MGKIIITIEDRGSTVSITAVPPMEQLYKKIASHGGDAMTPSETYAMTMTRAARELSASASSSIVVPVPRIGRQ